MKMIAAKNRFINLEFIKMLKFLFIELLLTNFQESPYISSILLLRFKTWFKTPGIQNTHCTKNEIFH